MNQMGECEQFPIYWDDTYVIARKLRQEHSDIRLEDVSLGMILEWTLGLPGFCDDAVMVNEDILITIYREWLEESMA